MIQEAVHQEGDILSAIVGFPGAIRVGHGSRIAYAAFIHVNDALYALLLLHTALRF
jgi:hypothetical protein